MPSFERFLMAHWSARSTLVNFTLRKNLTSKRCIPIKVLTTHENLLYRLAHTHRLIAAWFLADLQDPFWLTSPFFFHYQAGRGSTRWKTVPIGLLCQFPLLAITAYTHVTCCWNLSRFETTFFWPTNKDSIQNKSFKPIGFLMLVKRL